MRRRARRAVAIAATGAIASFALASTASAASDQVQIRAVFLGANGTSFIELQATGDAQNLAGQSVCIYHNTGPFCSSYILPPSLSNVGNQHTILISENTSPAPDVPVTAGVLHTDLSSNPGAACYSTVDCVSWGAFTNSNIPSPAGTPLSGLSSSMVAFRGITRGCPTALDAADDTNNSAGDFSFGIFPPRANATTPTEVLCPTPPATTTKPKKRCAKHKNKTGASAAKKKKCKKKKHH
jgi:hypothetical protein